MGVEMGIGILVLWIGVDENGMCRISDFRGGVRRRGEKFGREI